MKFKVDENLPVEVAAVLAEAGHDALTVRQQELNGVDDPPLYQVCKREGRSLVTMDTGFANIKAYPPEDGPGIVVMRLSRQDKPFALDVLARLVPLFSEEPVSGLLWIVEDDRVRVRGS